MKNAMAALNVSDWVTLTNKIQVRWDQFAIDHGKRFGQLRRLSSFGQVRSLSDDTVHRWYHDPKAALRVDFIEDLVFYTVTRMSTVVMFLVVSTFLLAV